MVQVFQDFQALLNDGVAATPFNMGDEADPTGVMFVGRVVEALTGDDARAVLFWHGGTHGMVQCEIFKIQLGSFLCNKNKMGCVPISRAIFFGVNKIGTDPGVCSNSRGGL